MEKVKVLFIDDDTELGHVVSLALKSSGYEIYYQTSLAAIKSVIKDLSPDIIIIDVEIGTENGIDITPELRLLVPGIPILFVSSHTDSDKVVKAMNAGGVAYLKKPFDVEELIAYIDRYAVAPCIKINIGNIVLDVKEKVLIKDNKIIEQLSQFECKLITLLSINKNKIVSRKEIENELWPQGQGNEHSLNNYIHKLRKALSVDPQIEIITIPKKGYKLLIS